MLLTMSLTINTVAAPIIIRSEEHTSELQSPCNFVCRLLLEKKKVYALSTKSYTKSILSRTIYPSAVKIGVERLTSECWLTVIRIPSLPVHIGFREQGI